MEKKINTFSLFGNASVLFLAVLIVGSIAPLPSGAYVWSFDPGDSFYHAFEERYSYNDTDETIFQNAMFLKSKILDIKDIDGDFDKLPDPIIFSSLLHTAAPGVELEIANPIDIYNFLPNDAFNPFSAIHSVSSQSYSIPKQFVESVPSDDVLQDFTVQEIEGADIQTILLFTAMQSGLGELPNEDFENQIEGRSPLNWKWVSSDKSNNIVPTVYDINRISTHPYKKSLKLAQNGNQQSPNTIQYSVIDVAQKNQIIPKTDNFPNYNYYVNTSRLSFNLVIPDFNTENFEYIINYSQPYSFSRIVGGALVDYVGFNGITFKIGKDYFGLYRGNYDLTSSGSVVEIPIEERGWKIDQFPPELGDFWANYTKVGLTSLRFDVILNQNDYMIIISDPFGSQKFPVGDLKYTLNYVETIDKDQFAYNSESSRFKFNPFNFYNFEFSVNNGYSSSVYFDNLKITHDIQDFESDLILPSIALRENYYEGISFYHGLIYPFEIDIARIINIFEMINILWESMNSYQEAGLLSFPNDQLTNMFDFDRQPFQIYRDTNYVKVVSNELLSGIAIAIIDLLFSAIYSGMDNAVNNFINNMDYKRYALGERVATFTLSFDLNVNALSEISLTTRYKDLGINHEQAFKLIATDCRMGVAYPDKIPSSYYTRLGIDSNTITEFMDYYEDENGAPLYESLGIGEYILNEYKWHLVGFLGISVGLTFGIKFLVNKIKIRKMQ